MKVLPIETGNFKLDGGAMFGVVPKSLWTKKYPCDDKNLCNWSLRCLLVDTGDRKILIDSGIGTKQDHKFLRHYYLNGEDTLLKSLKDNGYAPEDITDVFHTHLHFDHCGGSITYDSDEKLVPTFPNAKYWVNSDHWDWAVEPNRRERASFLKENILPMRDTGVLQLVDKEAEIYPGFSVKFFNGHTVGQLIPFIRLDNGKTLIYTADLLPSAAHVPMPYIMGYDVQPLITLKDKERLFDFMLKNDSAVFFEHDLFNECATVTQGRRDVEVAETLSLSDVVNG